MKSDFIEGNIPIKKDIEISLDVLIRLAQDSNGFSRGRSESIPPRAGRSESPKRLASGRRLALQRDLVQNVRSGTIPRPQSWFLFETFRKAACVLRPIRERARHKPDPNVRRTRCNR